MVKETKFRHHPTRIETGLFMGSQQLDILGVELAFLDAALTSAASLNTTGWLPMNLYTLVVAAGATVPRDAIAVILDVEVNDSGAPGDYYMDLASVEHSGGAGVQAGKTETVYVGQVTDRKGARIIIMELSDNFNILTRITASGGNFDYSINLIGWLIGGTRVSRVTWPSADLYAKFAI
jgi:hypothetical protein